MNALFNESPKALIALKDGVVFEGYSCGVAGEASGTLAFDTSASGYQQAISSAEHAHDVLVFTYPQIGNSGCNAEDDQGGACAAVVVRDLCATPSSFRSTQSLPAFLQQRGIVAIEGIDTRALTAYVRDHGAQSAIVSTVDLDPASLARRATEL